MANQVIPVSTARIGRDNQVSYVSPIPDTAVSILSLSVRVGKKRAAIGAVQSINFTLTREVEEYYEIRPYAPNDFGSLTALFNNQSFNDSIDYEGEPSVLIPGVVQPVPVTLTRPMFYSSNILEAIFKSSGAGEYTTQEMDDFRYQARDSSFLKDLGRLGVRALKGAAAGALLGAGRGQGLLGGAVAGGIQATLTPESDPNKVRYGNLLQQTRPLTLSFLVYSPTSENSEVAFGLEFVNGWATTWSIDDVSPEAGVLMENIEVTFERIRTIYDFK